MSSLPIPNAQAQVQSQQLATLIQNKIRDNNGWLSFADFMHVALYTPGLGYYSGGAKKFGLGGDFVTAPEISVLFGQTLANQVAQVLAESHGSVLELGAGTGKLAVDIMLALERLGQLPAQYCILEVSAHLRQIQKETIHNQLPEHLSNRLVWLDALPQDFVGVILGNEVLDAIPVHLVHHTAAGLFERGVAIEDDFVWRDAPLLAGDLYDFAHALQLPEDYLTEVCPAASGLMKSLAHALKLGAILMVDYGFSAREYYHPQRNLGTLMCHYQHYAHTDPLHYVGLQDITAHVDFTSIAHAGVKAGLEFAGFTSQAQFLMNCGMLNLMSQVPAEDMANYVPLAAAAQKLLSPAEMGDLFKVIAFVKQIESPLMGFSTGDKSHTL
jgi:SAM-dependent MidA family methyltransferase